MKLLHIIKIESNGSKPLYGHIPAKNFNEGLLEYSKTEFPQEQFDGLNHLKMFFSMKFKNVKSDKDFVLISDKGLTIALSMDLSKALSLVSNPLNFNSENSLSLDDSDSKADDKNASKVDSGASNLSHEDKELLSVVGQ